MKTYYECIPCIINQAVTLLDLCKSTDETKKEVISELIKHLGDINYNLSPSENTDIVYRLVSEHTGIADPYYNLKKEYNIRALTLYPELEKILKSEKDPLYIAARIAIAGNVIDLGINYNHSEEMDFQKILKNIKELPLEINDYPDFAKKLKNSKKILYMADNAGEIVFDKIFISELVKNGKVVTVSVKSGPIINDANIEDAVETGIDKIAILAETGHNKIGNSLKFLSNKFLKIFKNSDLIICKGQGNFETLDQVKAPIYFLLKAKCKSVAKELGVNYLDTVFAKSRNFQ